MLREVAGGTGIGVNFNARQRAGRAAPAKPLTTARSARLAERESHKGLAGGPPGRSHNPEVRPAIRQTTTLTARQLSEAQPKLLLPCQIRSK